MLKYFGSTVLYIKRENSEGKGRKEKGVTVLELTPNR